MIKYVMNIIWFIVRLLNIILHPEAGVLNTYTYSSENIYAKSYIIVIVYKKTGCWKVFVRLGLTIVKELICNQM